MSAFCRARTKDRQDAFASLQQAFQIGHTLDPGQREMSTLPLAAMDLLRLIDPRRVLKIEKIKTKLEHQTGLLHQAVERQAADLETDGHAAQFREAGENLAGAIAQAEQETEKKLHVLVAKGDQSFRHLFAQARNMLGEKWPLFSAAALPQAPQFGPPPGQKLAAAAEGVS